MITATETITATGNTLTVYGKANCVQCRHTERKMNNLNITYTKQDVETNQSSLEFVKSLGYQAAPVVVITDEKGNVLKSWSGFRPDEIDSLTAE